MILLTILIFALAIFLGLYFAQIKGAIGENRVARKLNLLPQNQYRLINNVLIKTNNGSSQIDHVLVSVYGIFVIETKNYKGIIYGGEFSDQWTKNVYGNKYKFFNPLKQNYGHIMVLSELLRLDKNMFIPIVVFSDEAKLRLDVKQAVVNISNLNYVIGQYKVPRFQENKLDEIVSIIQSNNIDSKENRKEHVQQVKGQVNAKKTKIKMNICPRCGGQLVKRSGKYGKFIGCSNYPSCRYTAKIETHI